MTATSDVAKGADVGVGPPRGAAMTRIETFCDAAFAFALTLLVVSIDRIPNTYDELIAALMGVPTFAASAALLMWFWYAHHTWSRRYGLDDGPTVILTVALVFTVMVFVYPLKAMMGGLLYWLSGQRLPLVMAVRDGGELYGLFAVYAAGFVAMAGIVAGLYFHAWRCRDVLQLSGAERFDCRTETFSWVISMGVGLLSLAIAWFAPPSYWLPAGMVWFARC